jgi:hypothetical protein
MISDMLSVHNSYPPTFCLDLYQKNPDDANTYLTTNWGTALSCRGDIAFVDSKVSSVQMSELRLTHRGNLSESRSNNCSVIRTM